jgi:hypothetical protein
MCLETRASLHTDDALSLTVLPYWSVLLGSGLMSYDG